MKRFRTYTAYSIACAIVWGVLLLLVVVGAEHHNKTTLLLVFAGWSIGWLSATIARFVYPPPKAWRHEGPTPSAP
jgi:hypothetical protein